MTLTAVHLLIQAAMLLGGHEGKMNRKGMDSPREDGGRDGIRGIGEMTNTGWNTGGGQLLK